MSDLEVIAIHYGMEVLLLSDDTNIPITTWYDSEGEECIKDNATVCVAGPDSDGKWYAEGLENVEPVTMH